MKFKKSLELGSALDGNGVESPFNQTRTEGEEKEEKMIPTDEDTLDDSLYGLILEYEQHERNMV